MASLNGTTLKNHIGRKGWVQPVLPALPLSFRVKKDFQKTGEDVKSVVNGVESQSFIKEQNQAQSGPNEISTEYSEMSIDAIRFTARKSVHEGPNGASYGSPLEVEKGVNQGHCAPAFETRELDETPISIAHEAVHHTEQVPRQSTGVAIPTGTLETGLLAQEEEHSNSLLNDHMGAMNGHSHSKVLNHASDPELEVVVAAGGMPLVPYPLPNQSFSDHTIQRSLEYGHKISGLSDASKTSKDQNFPKSSDSMSPEVILNGSNSPPHSAEVFRGTLVSPVRQPAFPSIHSHIANIEQTQEWCDCELHVFPPNSGSPSIHCNAHSLFLLRSERLRHVLYPQRAHSCVYYTINLLPARAIDLRAFQAALRFLYTDTILSVDRFMPLDASLDRPARAHALNYVFSYMVAGLELGIQVIVGRAFELLGRLIDWDLAELCVKEAQTLRAAVNKIPQSPPELTITAQSIFQNIFNLWIFRLDIQRFVLDKTSSPTELASRFAQLDPGRAPVNPALAKMVFGSMPASTMASPVSSNESAVDSQHLPNATASVIMLNLDFEDFSVLARTLMKAYGQEGKSLVAEVVDERERRRLSILESRTVSNKQRIANQSLWDVVGWREFVDKDTLERERVGFLLSSRQD